MMMFRALVVGLLGAIALLIASEPVPAQQTSPLAAVAASPGTPAAAPESAIVDVSLSRAGGDVMPLLGLAPGERVVALDGVRADTLALAAQWERATASSYLDVAVRTPAGGERRILVLVHP